MLEWAGSKITDGTDQQGRISAALQPGYFNVDELVFEQLLAMGAEFAAQLNFYTLKNENDGNWAEMFSADEAVIMAMILSTDMKRMESGFLNLYSGGLEPLVGYVLQWAGRINFWLNKLEHINHPAGVALRQKLGAIVEEKLAHALHNVAEISSRLEKTERFAEVVDYSSFVDVWGIKQSNNNFLFPRASIVDRGSDDEIARQLRSAFYVFFNAISYLKTITPVYLQESLASQQHDPATGLFMVFLKLYEKARQTINRFSQRHLDFYYQQMLQAKPRQALAESINLLLEFQPGSPNSLIEKGRKFSAGKDAQLNDIIYCADTELWLSDARVESLYSLYLQHDELVAPESELGYATRIKVNQPPLLEVDEPVSTAWPLFGEEKQAVDNRHVSDAEIGFSIASPLLLLKEGQRRIELEISLEDMIKVDADTMTAMLCCSDNGAAFTKLFGRLFSRYLLSHPGWLSADNKKKIITAAEALLSRSSANEINKLIKQDWRGLFYQLLKDSFCIKLTTQTGWFEVQDYMIMPHGGSKNGNASGSTSGLKICFSLGSEIESVVPYSTELHGGRLDTQQPLLQCCVNSQANFFSYSLFTDFVVRTMAIDVEVKGIKNLLAYNNHGQLDPSKPFTPFGPLPSNNSYFIFGNYELAKKKLVALNLNLGWGELPTISGGFTEHYRAYETDYDNDSFKVAFATLADGNWQPVETGAEDNVSLFDTQQQTGQPMPERVLKVNVLEYAKPVSSAISEAEYGYDLGSRNGFFKIGLSEPGSAFGHAEYSALLPRVLAENARRKKPAPTPNPPYTPILNAVSLDYRASSKISVALNKPADQSATAERVFHHHPFGIETVYPGSGDKPPCLLPQYDYQGNLFIALSAKQLSGAVTLFFHLSDDHAQEVAVETPQIRWFYLAADKWKSLPAARVLADTTKGFLASGLITLDIPADIDRGNQLMPGDYYWLRVSAEQGLKGFCKCYSVHTNGLQVTRKDSAKGVSPQLIAVPAKWQAMSAITGLGKIHQIGRSFGGRAGENDTEFKTRLSERLRHKNRASMPGDYERMILEHFPTVAKVKCFANMVSSHSAPAPGHVLIVVVPKVEDDSVSPSARAMISSMELSRIRSFVQRHSSAFIKLEVRNPAYEQVQVRCTVKFSSGMSDAAWVKRLDQDIAAYLSPWKRVGYQARFGWSIRQKDIESFIRELDYVNFITNFSMLHITVDGEHNYRLDDTAQQQQSSEMQIRPRFPWSLVLPAKHHFIETMPTAHSIKAAVTGIDELEIGSTFIISGNSEYGEEE